MAKCNFIIHVSQSYNPKRDHCKRGKKLFSCICEYIKSFLHFLPRAKFVLLHFLSFSLSFFHRLSLHDEPSQAPSRGFYLGLLFSLPQSNPRGRHPSLRPLDVFTMNPYLPGCQCDIYVTRYCVSERVIEIFLAERAPGSIPLAESASRNDLRTRESFSFDK